MYIYGWEHRRGTWSMIAAACYFRWEVMHCISVDAHPRQSRHFVWYMRQMYMLIVECATFNIGYGIRIALHVVEVKGYH